VNSMATGSALAEAGFNDRNVDLVYNGIDENRFRPMSADARALGRRVLGLDADSRVVGLFGRIARWKGQQVLIEALADLPGVTALIVGAPLFQDDMLYLAEIESLASRLGVDDRVVFAGSRSDVAGLMPLCDVVAHTSVAAEPFGRVIVEAMLCSVPVVATRAGGALEILGDDEHGLLI